jgi:hypothetical protein
MSALNQNIPEIIAEIATVNRRKAFQQQKSRTLEDPETNSGPPLRKQKTTKPETLPPLTATIISPVN